MEISVHQKNNDAKKTFLRHPWPKWWPLWQVAVLDSADVDICKLYCCLVNSWVFFTNSILFLLGRKTDKKINLVYCFRMDGLYFYLLSLVYCPSGHLGPSSTAHRFTLFIYVYNDFLFAKIWLKVSNLWLVLLRHYDKPIQFTQSAPQQCNKWNPMVPS